MVKMNNNNFLYRIHITKKPKSKINYFHEKLNNSLCFIDFLEIGHPLLGRYKSSDEKYFRLFQSSTVRVINEKEDGNIFIETNNSFYKFEKINDVKVTMEITELLGEN